MKDSEISQFSMEKMNATIKELSDEHEVEFISTNSSRNQLTSVKIILLKYNSVVNPLK